MLPLLDRHGLSSGDFVPALEQFLGSAAGLSPATVTRLTKQWRDDQPPSTPSPNTRLLWRPPNRDEQCLS